MVTGDLNSEIGEMLHCRDVFVGGASSEEQVGDLGATLIKYRVVVFARQGQGASQLCNLVPVCCFDLEIGASHYE